MKKESIVIVHHYGTVIETWVLHLPPVSVGELLGCEDDAVYNRGTVIEHSHGDPM